MDDLAEIEQLEQQLANLGRCFLVFDTFWTLLSVLRRTIKRRGCPFAQQIEKNRGREKRTFLKEVGGWRLE